MIKIGVIGCGKIAEKHLNAYKKIDDIDVFVSDIVEKGRVVANKYGAKWYDDPERLILEGKVDAIDICVPTPSHHDFIVKALKSGKHVFCEKPLASSIEEAEQIQAKAMQTNKLIMVGYLYRFHPAFEFANDIIKEKIIGEPYYAFFRLGGRGSHKAWKHLKKTGGGAANEMLVHMLDLVVWYFGEITKVDNLYTDIILKERMIENKIVKPTAEDLTLLKIDTTSDVKVLCQCDLITPSYMNFIEIHGTNGSMYTSILDHFPTNVYCKEPIGIYDRGNNFFKFSKVDLFEKELRYFISCMKNRCVNDVDSLRDSISVMKAINILYKEND
ncbi:MAG: Gfo/Idh/MocA family oxidoreductase [Candidatus Heimdallarchaeota archaeon]|nr:MAG: Gfo/Idh/MocA family oxidoreductase [Candidatus Aminicenantes bacterium]UCG02024.1 MAG: Gfo/Idh/MocA family oxidoreductase [Candidatus Heimdallarchaeota archaeon]